MKYLLKLVAFVLVIVGALNWGLVGLFNFNLVDALLGSGLVSSIVYCLVGLSAVVLVVFKALKHNKKRK
jgi:uncharacterized membrane protein YuzA (DUF378 family)